MHVSSFRTAVIFQCLHCRILVSIIEEAAGTILTDVGFFEAHLAEKSILDFDIPSVNSRR